MKLRELKCKFKNKYAIRIVAGVLIVALAATGVSVYDVSAAKGSASQAGNVETEKNEETGKAVENKLDKALGSGITINEKEIGKEETVYVITDSAGKAEEVIVSDHLVNEDGRDMLEDVSSLQDIKNVKGEETFKQSGTKLTWQADGKDIYYQGTAGNKTPVTQKITYFLDGKEISPEDLAGKSGSVTIRFDYTNNEKIKADIAGKETEICVPFVAISGMVLDDSFSHIKVKNGKVMADGDNNLVVGYALPGLKEGLNVKDSDFDSGVSIPDYFEVTADVEEFSLDMTMTAVMNATNFIRAEDGDLGGIDELFDTLKDAAGQLEDGSLELSDGMNTLRSKLSEFSGGVNTLKEGITGYTDGAANLSNGIGSLKNGVDTLAGSVPALTDGVSKLKNGADSAAAGASALTTGTGSLKKGAGDLSKGIGELSTGAKNLSAGAGELSTGVQSVASGAKELSAGASSLSAGASSLNEGVGTLVTKLQGMSAELSASRNSVMETFKSNAGMEYGESANAALDSLKNIQAALANGISAETQAAAYQAEGKTDECNAAMQQAAGYYRSVEAGLSLPNESIGNAAAAANIMVQVSSKIADLQSGIAQVNGAVSVIDTVSGSLGSEETASQLAALKTGAAELSAGVSELSAGAGTLSAGAEKTVTGAAALAVGAKDLSDGVEKAVTGAAQVAEGAGKLAEGADSLSAGLGTLDQGLTELNNKAGSLSGGVSQLKNGTDQLATGAAALTSNNTALTEGVQSLADGTGALVQGVDKLKDGAKALAEGMIRFNEEGIEEILNAYNGDIEPLAERIQAVLSAGADYQSYTGIADGMNGSVKFIYKSAAVKPEN